MATLEAPPTPATREAPAKPPRLKLSATQPAAVDASERAEQQQHVRFQSPLVQRRDNETETETEPTLTYATIQPKHGNNHSNQQQTASASDRTDGPVIENASGAKPSAQRLTHGCNSLMYACQHGDIAVVLEHLRSKPESLQQRDSHNKNALHYCAAAPAAGETNGDLVAAASIAIAAPELLGSADEDGFTPLHLAVIQGNLAMVNLLLANKADVNAVDKEGHSVVHWATVCGEVEALRSVLSAGANATMPDVNGGSPLHYAAQMCGANYEGKLGQANSAKLALEILGILLAHPQTSVDIQDKDGRQPLLWAASAGSAKAVISLVKAGARVESADKDGLTALHCAASRGHTECLDTLISLCGAPTDLIDSNGCTALHYAVTLGHADATSRLLDLEADPNRQDRKGRTPAHCGCSKGQFETVKLLRERGANLWLRNAKGDLPVHEAACSGRRELVEWLLEQRPKQVNTTSNDGRSLLHIAAANDYADMCKVLLDYGADINAVYRNSKGKVITPLDCALHRGNRSTAKFLQSNGGLPSGKLRLAARRANPFQEAAAEMPVRPLKYAEKEELYDLRNSKKYVVYMKRSDSDGGAAEAGDANCSCTEQTYKREQRLAHTCRRHRQQRLRRRTSSCGEAVKQKNLSDEGQGVDLSRSKSNIELRRRRKHSREHRVSSSDSAVEHAEDDDERDADEDSCENCCYHKRQKHRVLRRRSISSRRSRDRRGGGSEQEEESRKKITGAGLNEHMIPIDIEGDPKLKSAIEPQNEQYGVDNSSQTRPRSATKRQTPPPPTSTMDSPIKEGTFIKLTSTSNTNAMELTDDDSQANKAAEVVTTQVDVHREAEDASIVLASPNTAEVEAAEKPTDSCAEISEVAAKQVEQVLEAATIAVNGKKQSVEEANGNPLTEEPSNELKPTAKADQPAPTLVETPATPVPTPEPSPLASPAPTSNEQQLESSASAVTPAPKTSEPDPINTETVAPDTPSALPPIPVSDEKALADVASDSKNQSQQQQQREQESRRSFTLLPSDSADEENATEVEPVVRKSSFQVLKSDESIGDLERGGDIEFRDSQVFKIVSKPRRVVGNSHSDAELSSPGGVPGEGQEYDDDEDVDDDEDDDGETEHTTGASLKKYRNGMPMADGVTGIFDYGSNGQTRKRRLKKRVKSGSGKGRQQGNDAAAGQQSGKDQDSGFEPSPRAMKSSKIPTPRSVSTAHEAPRHSMYQFDGRSCSSRLEHRKPGDRAACDMSAVTRSIQRNIRRYYMERKIFQHLLELKSLQIRSNKLNEAVLVKRAVDDYHKSCASLGSETGTRLRRYTFSEYTFKNFELFLYETLKSLQKPGTYNFQNINEVYEEAERRLSPDYNAYEKALQCTNKTHRCLHAAHAYTGIPCAAYIANNSIAASNVKTTRSVEKPNENFVSPPASSTNLIFSTPSATLRFLPRNIRCHSARRLMQVPLMNHHTMPKFGFGPYKKTGVSSFYLPKIVGTRSSTGGGSGTGTGTGEVYPGKVALEVTHGKSRQLIPLPSDKMDSNKRYYVTFTLKEPVAGASAPDKQQQGDSLNANNNTNGVAAEK